MHGSLFQEIFGKKFRKKNLNGKIPRGKNSERISKEIHEAIWMEFIEDFLKEKNLQKESLEEFCKGIHGKLSKQSWRIRGKFYEGFYVIIIEEMLLCNQNLRCYDLEKVCRNFRIISGFSWTFWRKCRQNFNSEGNSAGIHIKAFLRKSMESFSAILG